MRTIRIDLNTNSIVWDSFVTARDAHAQTTAVNLLTDRGSDWTDLERGSVVRVDFLSSGLLDVASAQHALNFELLSSRRMLRRYPEEGQQQFSTSAKVTSLEGRKVKFDLEVKTDRGQTTIQI